MNHSAAHTALVKDILVAIGSRPDCRAFVMNRGKARNPQTGQWVEFGIRGQGDVLALLGNGHFLWIEAKTGSGRQSPDQRDFDAMIRLITGTTTHYIVARSAEDATRAVDLLLGASR